MRPTAPTKAICLCLVLLGSGSLAAQSIADLRASGMQALQTGEYYSAIEAFSAALAINARDLRSTVGLAESYYGIGEFDQAEEHANAARSLSGSDPEVLTLSGRIAIGLGDLDQADEYFRSARELEPNNVSAEVGLAELALADGRSLDAVQSLERALRFQPGHRKALLSLVLIHEQNGDLGTAERYLETALRTHAGEPAVHVLAAEYAMRRGDTAAAASHARTAQAIDPENRAAAQIRTTAVLLDGRYIEAITSVEELLRNRRTDPDLWYLRGQALLGTGDVDAAVDSFRTALRYAPGDETVRYVVEDTVMNSFPLDDENRSALASFVADRARKYLRDFRYSRALEEFRRALRLSPLDTDLRREYAEVFRTLGYLPTYLQELRVIQDSGVSSSELTQLLSIYSNELSESVSRTWDVDQFTVVTRQTRIGLYLVPPHETIVYPLSENAMLHTVARGLRGLDRVNLVLAESADTYTAALTSARLEDVDYFIQLSLQRTDRTIHLRASLHVGRTGTEVATISVDRAGPDRVSEAFAGLVSRVADLLPFSGQILLREGNRVLIDAGARHGIEEDADLMVLDSAGLVRAPSDLTFRYDDEAVLGSVRIAAVDDLVSEGTLSVEGLFDTVVPGDIVLLPSEDEDPLAVTPRFPILYERIRVLR